MSSRTRPGRSRRAPNGRRSRRDDEEIPEVYKEMLAEAESREEKPADDEREAKRFKPVGFRPTPAQAPVADQPAESINIDENATAQQQTVYISPSESDESDMEWEEVDIQQPSIPGPSMSADTEPLQITLEQQKDQKQRIVRRKPITAAEKKRRLDVHKMHLLCLMGHVEQRNLWCNDKEVQVRCNLLYDPSNVGCRDLLKEFFQSMCERSSILPKKSRSILDPPCF